MSEASATHHKIKAEWTKASKNEIYDNSSSESDKLEIVEDVGEETSPAPSAKIKILEQIVIYPNQKSVKCHFCDKNFEKSFLEEHQRIHDTTFFHCLDCDKKFKRKSSLRKHSYLHKGKFKYECKECKVTFIDLTKFELHKNTKHKTKDSIRYHCQTLDCGKSFASPEYLKRHQITHNGESSALLHDPSLKLFQIPDEFKYKCSVCEQKFKWMTSLQLHQTIHTQNKALVECSKCFKRFFNQRTLERHQRIHKNLKYKCTLCEKVVSNRKDNIRRHIRHLHTDVEKSEIADKIAMIRDAQNMQIDDDDDSTTSDPVYAQIDERVDDVETAEITPEALKQPSPPPVINNRVHVIQSIGNPNKNQTAPPQVEQPPQSQPPEATKAQENELKLPPKKKPIAEREPSSSSSVSLPTAKPKYDPIQHYRKILLGFSKDDDHPTHEETIEEDESEQEPQVFPVHWRKRTSQNFLFRR